MIRNSSFAALPQLQVWRPGAFVFGSFILQSSTGNMSELRGTEPLYRYVPATPISVMAGDVLGIHIPRIPLLLLRFRDVGDGNTHPYFIQSANAQQIFIIISSFASQSRYIPFVSVELGESICTTSSIGEIASKHH